VTAIKRGNPAQAEALKLSWRSHTVSRLALGTAQLGMDYGIANIDGKPDLDRAKSIVRAALAEGINFFDTAQGYGASETVLGAGLAAGARAAQAVSVVTKIAPDFAAADRIAGSLRESLAKVGVPRFFGVLLHGADALGHWGERFRPLFERLLADRLTDYIGVSIYTDDEMETALGIPEIDIIQLPFNVFDQRALAKNWFNRAQGAGKLLIVRSIFLQGLLLLDPKALPSHMSFARRPLDRWRRFCRSAGVSSKEACIGFVLKSADGAAVVFGAETPAQVAETASLAKVWEKQPFSPAEWDEIGREADPRLINPSLWTARGAI